MGSIATPNYLDISKAKKAEQLSKIPKEWQVPVPPPVSGSYMGLARTCGLLDDNELRLTEAYDAVDLRDKMASGELTSSAVTRAFCKRAAVAQQALCCLTEIFFDEALDRARWLDEEFARTGKPVGPLHGLPISLKDTFGYKGVDATAGLAVRAHHPAIEHGILAQMLLDAGAVLYCKTNVPQSLMTADSDNHLFGRTLNPKNTALTAGGSSGGEGALIAFRGSVLGVGTDIAGSIRIPAWCHGDYALKPTVGLVPYYGEQSVSSNSNGSFGIYPVAGPMATSPRALDMFMEVISAASPSNKDFTCLPVPWAASALLSDKNTRLSIGLLRSDGLVRLLPPVARALDEAKTKLEVAGFEVIEMDWVQPAEAYDVGINFLQLDGGKALQTALSATGEPYIPSIVHNPFPFPPLPAKTLDEYFALNLRRSRLADAWQRAWNLTPTTTGRPIDAILCPLTPFPPPRIDMFNYDNMAMVWNLIDYPAAVFPVTTFDQDMDVISLPENPLPPSPLPLGGEHGKYDERVRELWSNPSEYGSISLGLQLVGRRHEDAKLVKVLARVAEVVNNTTNICTNAM